MPTSEAQGLGDQPLPRRDECIGRRLAGCTLCPGHAQRNRTPHFARGDAPRNHGDDGAAGSRQPAGRAGTHQQAGAGTGAGRSPACRRARNEAQPPASGGRRFCAREPAAGAARGGLAADSQGAPRHDPAGARRIRSGAVRCTARRRRAACAGPADPVHGLRRPGREPSEGTRAAGAGTARPRRAPTGADGVVLPAGKRRRADGYRTS